MRCEGHRRRGLGPDASNRMNSKKTAVRDRAKHLEDAIAKGHEYLEDGSHQHWHGFRPKFGDKTRNGQPEPPHKDWVKNVFLPRREKTLRKAEITVEKLIVRAGTGGEKQSVHAEAQ